MKFIAGLIINKINIKKIKKNKKDIKGFLFFFKNKYNLFLIKKDIKIKILLKKEQFEYINNIKKKNKILLKKIIEINNMLKAVIYLEKKIKLKSKRFFLK
ncbi:hypothetical protein ACWNYI_00495 [Candidatus Vidania fulgoroideorum]